MILLFVVALLHLPIGAGGAKAKTVKCVERHALNEETGECEWTGPKDACVELVDFWNRSYFMSLPDFPRIQSREVNLAGHPMNDYAVKVVVRKGCMFTGYAYALDGSAYQEIKVAENLVYGAHNLPSASKLDFNNYYDGLTRPNCWCDPTEATVNGHVPSPPPNKKCIEHHEFDEETQQCEWIRDPKFCAEIITTDNRRMRLEMPDWPEKKKYDVNHFATQRANNFHVMVCNVIVRQHCMATFIQWEFNSGKTLPTSGYGYWPVIHYPTSTKINGYGTGRFTCECIK